MYNYINILYLYEKRSLLHLLFIYQQGKSVSTVGKGSVSMDYVRTDVGIWCYMVATAMCDR